MNQSSTSTAERKEINTKKTSENTSPVVDTLMNAIKDETNNTTSTNQTLVSSTHGQRPTAMQKNVAPFLNKVYNMVNDPSSDDLIRWSADGKSFFVVRHEDFARSVLPRFFKHSNFSSFVRQLNMYGFHKVPHLQHGVLHSDNDSEQWEFSNPHFQRNQPDLLLLVTRKKGRETDEKEQLTTTNNIDLHHILEEIQVIKQHQMNISSQLKNIQNDNSVLWQETISARERHQRHQETIDKILRFLASVFSNDKSMAIPRKRRFLLEAPDSDNKAQQDIGYQSYGSSTGEENDCGRPTKVNKTGTTPEFKLEDYVSGLQGYTGIPSSSTTLPASLSQTKPSTNPTSELADAIALNDKSKQSSSVSSLRSPATLPQELTQMMSLQQIQGIQSLIGLAQSNPALLTQLTTDMFNNYHLGNSANSAIPTTGTTTTTTTNATTATPDYSQFTHTFDPAILTTLNNAITNIPSSSQGYLSSSLVPSPSSNRFDSPANLTQPYYELPSVIQPVPTTPSRSSSITSTAQLVDTNSSSRPATPDTILTSVPQQSTTPTNTTPAPIITPSRNTPSLPQVSNNIESLAKTADDINSDIDTLGSNIEALAQQLGFDPTKSNDDLLGYVDMDKFLQAYGNTDDTTNADNVYPSETISPSTTNPTSPTPENSGPNV